MFQAIRFDRTKWSTERARIWLGKHGYKPIKRVDITANELRYRIREPNALETYRYTTLGGEDKGIRAVYIVPSKAARGKPSRVPRKSVEPRKGRGRTTKTRRSKNRKSS